jgi:peptidyl-prolyl cis-trans isomerase D
MLQALRDKTSGWFTTVLLGFLAFLLVLSGLQGYEMSRADTSAAKVGDEKVAIEEYRARYSQQQTQFAQSGQDAGSFDTPERRRELLDEMVDEKLMEVAAKEAGLEISLQTVKNAIANDPTFQTDGKFDNAKLQSLLAANGLSEMALAARISDNFRKNIVRTGVYSSALVTDFDIDSHLKLRDQTRNFRTITLDVNDLPAPTAPSADDIKKYFEANAATKYMTTEFADFEYLRIQSANLPKIVATDAVLKKRYDDQAARFKTPERRKASHILIEVEGGESAKPEQQKAALAAANAVLAEVKAPGADFAAIARKSSKDLGSAEQGGDLGFIEKGTAEPAFETKLFAMKAGEISEPVLTSQGYHIIKLDELEAERVKTFDEARAELETEFLAQEGDAAFNKATGAAVDAAIANPQSLAAAAKAAGVTTQRTGLLSAIGQLEAGGSNDVATNPAFLKAAFAKDILERGRISDLITLSQGDAVLVRMATRKKSERKPLENVQAEIIASINSERQAQALKTKGEALLKSLNEGKTLDTLATELKKTIEVADNAGRNAANRDPKLSEEAFKAPRPASGKTSRVLATLSPDRIALVELLSVKDGDPKAVDQATRDSVRMQLAFQIAQAEFDAVKASLRASSKIVLHEDRLTSQ